MYLKGIDVSTYNVINDYYAAAADNVQFAIIKIINRTGLDKRFEEHWAGFEKAGIPIQGVYNYSYATTVAEFQTDARRVISALAGRETMVWLDIEDSSLTNLGSTLVDGILAYQDIIRAAGLPFGVYTYISYYNSYLKKYADRLNMPFWIARYPSTQNMDNDLNPNLASCPVLEGKTLYGWQYSSKGIVNGIPGNVDLDYWFVDIEQADIDDKNTPEVAPEEPTDDTCDCNCGCIECGSKKPEAAGTNLYPKYTGPNTTLINAMNSLGINSSYSFRKEIAVYNGISNYSGTAAQNTDLYNRLVAGTLKNPSSYYPKYTGPATTLIKAMASLGIDNSYDFRAKIAEYNGITGYKGTAAQNNTLYSKFVAGTVKIPA